MSKEKELLSADVHASYIWEGLFNGRSGSQIIAFAAKALMEVEAEKATKTIIPEDLLEIQEAFRRDAELFKLRRKKAESLSQEETLYLGQHGKVALLNEENKKELVKKTLKVSRGLFNRKEDDDRLSEKSDFYTYLLTHHDNEQFSDTMVGFINYIATLSGKDQGVHDGFIQSFPPLKSSGDLKCFPGFRTRLEMTYQDLLAQDVDILTKAIYDVHLVAMRRITTSFYPDVSLGNQVHLEIYLSCAMGMITPESAKHIDEFFNTPQADLDPKKMHAALRDYPAKFKKEFAKMLADPGSAELSKDLEKMLSAHKEEAIKQIRSTYSNDVIKGIFDGTSELIDAFMAESEAFKTSYGVDLLADLAKDEQQEGEDYPDKVWDDSKIKAFVAKTPLPMADPALTPEEQADIAKLSDIKTLYSQKSYTLIKNLLASDNPEALRVAIAAIWVMGENFSHPASVQFVRTMKEVGSLFDTIQSKTPESERFKIERTKGRLELLLKDETLKAYYEGRNSTVNLGKMIHYGYPIEKVIRFIKRSETHVSQSVLRGSIHFIKKTCVALAVNPYGQEIIEALITKDIKLTDGFLKECVLAATLRSNTALVEFLLKNIPPEHHKEILGLNTQSENVLYIATKKGNQLLLKLFIEKGVDVNASDNIGNTLLHTAVKKGQIGVVKALLEAVGVDVNAKNNNGVAPLHVAAQYGYADAVEVLLKKDADVDITLPNGSTPLHLAAEEGYATIVEKLLDKKADIKKATTERKMTPLHIAARSGKVEVVKNLISRGALIDTAAKNGLTAFYLAALNNHIEVVQLLIDKGANVNVKSSNANLTALHEAVSHGDLEMIEQLVNHPKTNVNGLNMKLKTPLDIACEKDNPDAAKALMKGIEKRKNANRLPLPIKSIKTYIKPDPPKTRAAKKSFEYCTKAAEHIANIATKGTNKAGMKDLHLYIRNALLDAYGFKTCDLMKDLGIKKKSDFDGPNTMNNNKNIKTLAKAIKDSLPLSKEAFEKVIEGLSKKNGEGVKEVLNLNQASMRRA